MSKENAPADPRVPLSLDEAMTRMRLAQRTRLPEELVSGAKQERVLLEDFRPVTRSLEWTLSRLHWRTAGTLPFADNEVPFLINNSGRLSEDAAALLFHNCAERPEEGPLVVLELGAGCGLFARYFLDTFEALCRQEGRGFFDRVLYFVTDASPSTVADWATRGIFTPFSAHVRPMVCAADEPGLRSELQSVLPPGAQLRAVFCNYVLDVLDSTTVRRNGSAVEELQVRTHLMTNPALLRQYTSLSASEAQSLARGAEASQLLQLLPLVSLFDVEAEFRPNQRLANEPFLAACLETAAEREPVLFHSGAFQCLDQLQHLLHPSGFILVNDYGPTRAGEQSSYSATQRFGQTTAQGLNFPGLDAVLPAAGWRMETPDGDSARSIHSRLLTRASLPETVRCFHNRFSAQSQHHFEGPLEEAREHSSHGRKQQALECFRTAVARAPRDWRVLGEAAEFVGLDLKDFSSGLQLAQAAVERNPWYSPWLWNVLGDCLYCLERFQDAHEAYLQAQRVCPADARTNLNLAYTWLYLGDFPRALQSIAAGLAVLGPYRSRLLDKQAEILAALDARRAGEQDRLLVRLGRLHFPPPEASSKAQPAT